MTQIPAIAKRKMTAIATTPRSSFPASPSPQKTCKLKKKHNRLQYYTGYIGSSEVSHIQFVLGSALSIRVMHHLGIPNHRLSTTQTTIYGSTLMVRL